MEGGGGSVHLLWQSFLGREGHFPAKILLVNGHDYIVTKHRKAVIQINLKY